MESRVSTSQIIDCARSYLNTPFRHRGRNRAGIDCAGLVICTLTDLGLMPNEYLEQLYSRVPKLGLVPSTLDRFFSKVSAIEAGDLIVFSFLNNPCHVGFFTGDTIIHAYEERGKVIEDDYLLKWERRFNSAYRIIN